MKTFNLFKIIQIYITLCSLHVMAGDFQEYVNKFITLQIISYDSIEYKENYVKELDESNSFWHFKVTLKAKKAIKTVTGQLLNQRFHCAFFLFRTDDESESAFSDFLNCYGPDCNILHAGKTVKGLKTIPCYVLHNPGKMVVIHTRCEDLAANFEFDRIKKDIFNIFADRQSSQLNIGCGGQVTWPKNTFIDTANLCQSVMDYPELQWIFHEEDSSRIPVRVSDHIIGCCQTLWKFGKRVKA